MSTGPFTASADAAGAPSGALLRNAAFLRLWLGMAASTLGDRIHQVALMWWVYAGTGSLALTGVVMIATTLPAVLLGPVAGVLADRWDRKKLMIATDVARGALVLGISALAAMQMLSFPVVVTASALLAALTALFMPANMAMVPALVAKDDLLRANSLMETTTHSAGLLGPAIGGLVVGALGATGAFGLNGLSFMISAVLLAGLAFPPRPATAAHESFAVSMRGGFRVLKENPTIAGLLACFACLNFFSISILLFLPHFAKSVFQVGATGLGLLEGSVAAGMMAASLFWARRGSVERRFPLFFGSIAAIAATYIFMGLFPSFGAYAGLLAVVGALFASINVVVMAFFQERVPPTEMGRFMGLLTSVVFGLMPLSYGVFGLLGGLVPPATLLMVNGGAIGLVALLLFLVPGLRRE